MSLSVNETLLKKVVATHILRKRDNVSQPKNPSYANGKCQVSNLAFVVRRRHQFLANSRVHHDGFRLSVSRSWFCSVSCWTDFWDTASSWCSSEICWSFSLSWSVARAKVGLSSMCGGHPSGCIPPFTDSSIAFLMKSETKTPCNTDLF